MSGPCVFETSAGLTARLGMLTLPNRKPIETPTYLAVTSRGSVPHLTPDNLQKCTFAAMPSEVLTILGPRRCPAVTTPVGNTAKTMSIFTSTGFRNVTVSEYASAVASLQPDIVVPMADLPHTSKTPVSKKLIRMVEHTELWLDEFLGTLSRRSRKERSAGSAFIAVFAPVLPVERPIQWDYLRHLSEDVAEDVSGLAVYDANLLPELAHYAPMIPLPKLSMDAPGSPHDVLRQIALGIDICVLPFVNNASDAGVAFTFSFPVRESGGGGGGVEPLGINMWDAGLSTAVVPLAQDCRCYACERHHRAYVRHLLNAKEMLGWSLLQIHNHHVVDEFFGGIRGSLAAGSEQFERDRARFSASYEPELPEGTGARPRARGYHFKSEAASERINKPSWTDLDKDGASPVANGHVQAAQLDE
ncbi:Queuine tRNA-ribosyltransferase-like protein [Escovopsis weberi]|uniref:Queuine tRNA-ribosyltransferase accessory subunit 2 n=1 Tax=Escovopsis weberi TaxID=150374 RepID=A0A0M9VUC9_ESCWE|nr:Queuine tRNA-ribosyltransferase-like protein [Escovopsis weberi]